MSSTSQKSVTVPAKSSKGSVSSPPTTEYAIELHGEVLEYFNQIVGEGPKANHRIRLNTVLNKITAGLIRIDSIPDYEMGPWMRLSRESLVEIKTRAQHLLSFYTPSHSDKFTQTSVTISPRAGYHTPQLN